MRLFSETGGRNVQQPKRHVRVPKRPCINFGELVCRRVELSASCPITVERHVPAVKSAGTATSLPCVETTIKGQFQRVGSR